MTDQATQTTQASAPAATPPPAARGAETRATATPPDPGSTPPFTVVDRRSSWTPRPPMLGPGATPHLNAALAALQAELPRIDKGDVADVENKQGQIIYSYSYANLGAVAAAVMPLLGKHGLAFTAWPTMRDGRFVLAYYLLHETGEQRDGEFPLSGGTSQVVGSAITYARRYCLSSVTGVAPDDQDDDGKAASDVPGSTTQRPNGGSGGQQQQLPQVPPEVESGRNAVRREWVRAFGSFRQDVAAARYTEWAEGRVLLEADGPELRRFASYLATLPDAAPPAAASNEGEKRQASKDAKGNDARGKSDRPVDPSAPGTINAAMRTKLQALLVPIYGKDRGRKIEFLQQWADRPEGAPAISSTNDLSWDESRALIDELSQQEKQQTKPADPPADDTQAEA